ncbi:MAG: amino-acid N-acetyltransferase [Pseudomonadota bacterium]|nr:amino-acid N-acetyltransferase [Pseudomonadota bacterium]
MHARPEAFVTWFRAVAPYVHGHRGRTFVICFGGEAVQGERFASLIHDIALLHSLGIRLVLAYGTRPQIEARLRASGLECRYVNDLRVTEAPALAAVKEAAGVVRIEIEALLSMGLANSPMANARLRIASGNFVTARPLGVQGGVDFHYTGEVRRIDGEAIQSRLAEGQIVLLPPLGYSPTGEVFNLDADDVATAVAIALRAGKLIFLIDAAGVVDEAGGLIRQITVEEAEAAIAQNRSSNMRAPRLGLSELQCAIKGCRMGVARAHLIDRRRDGALLLELFERDGIGTLVSAAPFDRMRRAIIDDVAGILELIEPLEAQGVLVRRSREKLEREIGHFTMLLRDEAIIGCAALYPYEGEGLAELACLTVHPDYRNAGRGEELLQNVEREARAAGLRKLFVLTTQAAHWFVERGMMEVSIEDLPLARQDLYNYRRNSKVFAKTL